MAAEVFDGTITDLYHPEEESSAASTLRSPGRNRDVAVADKAKPRRRDRGFGMPTAAFALTRREWRGRSGESDRMLRQRFRAQRVQGGTADGRGRSSARRRRSQSDARPVVRQSTAHAAGRGQRPWRRCAQPAIRGPSCEPSAAGVAAIVAPDESPERLPRFPAAPYTSAASPGALRLPRPTSPACTIHCPQAAGWRRARSPSRPARRRWPRWPSSPSVRPRRSRRRSAVARWSRGMRWRPSWPLVAACSRPGRRWGGCWPV